MELKWTSKALSNLARLEFLALVYRGAAAHIGERLEEFEAREVRRILVGRYEIQKSTIYVLWLGHTREAR